MMMRYLCVRRRTSLNSWAPTPFDQACMPLLFLWQEIYWAILTNSMLQVREIHIKILTNPFTMFACPNGSCVQNLYISWGKMSIKYVFKLQNCLGLYCIFFAKSALTSFCTIWGGFQVSPFWAGVGTNHGKYKLWAFPWTLIALLGPEQSCDYFCSSSVKEFE